MSNITNTTAAGENPTDQPQGWSTLVQEEFRSMANFIGTRKATYTTDWNLHTYGCPENNYDCADKPFTYTRADMKLHIIRILTTAKDTGRKYLADMPVGPNMGAKAMALWLTATNTHQGKTKLCVSKGLYQAHKDNQTAFRQAKMDTAMSAGTQWYAQGVFEQVKNAKGEWVNTDKPRAFVSRKKAVNRHVSENFTGEGAWHLHPDKKLMQANSLQFVSQGAPAPSKAKATKAKPTVQSKVTAKGSKADLVKQAVALGLPANAAKSMTKAKLSATIGALSNL